jgi:hypothetical protein
MLMLCVVLERDEPSIHLVDWKGRLDPSLGSVSGGSRVGWTTKC